MQNWLAPTDPDLFFGLPGGRPLPRPGADSGAIVFTQRLMEGESVEVVNGEHCGRRGIVIGADDDTSQPYNIQLDMPSPVLPRFSAPRAADPSDQPFDISIDDVAELTVRHEQREQAGQPDQPNSDTNLTSRHEQTEDGASSVDGSARSRNELEAIIQRMPVVQEEPLNRYTGERPCNAEGVVQLWPNELRRVVVDTKLLTKAAGADRLRVLEACILWTPRIAGRLCEMPTRGVTSHGDVMTFEEPIRFWCPKDALWPAFVVQANLQCTAHEVSFSHVKLAPWSALERHWLVEDGGGLDGPHHEPLIKTRVLEFKPHYGANRKEHVKQLPIAYRRLVADAIGHSSGKRLIQSSDGTVTQTCQCSNGNFDAVRSVHSIRFEDQPKIDTFTITLVRCANERAAGLRVGVCSDDGKKAWMLRLSDCRLCDASGMPVQGAKPFMDDWNNVLPPSLMGYNVIVYVEMGNQPSRRKLYFCLQDCGGPKFEAFVGLPSVVRPCVHLTHKGDAVRIDGHTTLKIRTPGELAAGPTRAGGANPKPAARYLTWSPARYRRDPEEEKYSYTRSLRTLRPVSPTASPTGSPRPGSPSGRRRRKPQPAVAVSVTTAAGPGLDTPSHEPRLLMWTPAGAPTGVKCAHCREVATDGRSPWCQRCKPRLTDPFTRRH